METLGFLDSSNIHYVSLLLLPIANRPLKLPFGVELAAIFKEL